MKKTVSIIGGGSSALLLAAFLDTEQFDVTIYEKGKSLGRKFLVAGKGGFNLTHSEAMESFVERYTPPHFLKKALLSFSNTDLRHWLESIGIPTFIGTSKRVFPVKCIKPIAVLNAILAVLHSHNVGIKTQHEWTAWGKNNALIFNSTHLVKSDYNVFALGGASWKITGSDGTWLGKFRQKGIPTQAFAAANCAYAIDWSADFIEKNAGQPLKNIAVHCAHKVQKGELVLTEFGLEGNAIYALSPFIQTQLLQQQKAFIFIDLKPNVSEESLLQRFLSSREKNTSNTLRKVLKLSSVQVNLLKTVLPKADFLNPSLLCTHIKKLPLIVTKAAPIDEAISTTGGIDLAAVNADFELKNMEKNYCIGEMLDWNAPTGGYLLQACFSMAFYVAKSLNEATR